MTAPELLHRLVGIVPEFQAEWDSPDNCFRADDGDFIDTLHGVFGGFSGCFQARAARFSPEQAAALGKFVSDCMASGDGDLDNAAATCFLENIAGQACAAILAGHLSGEARRYLQAWSGRDK